MMQRGYDRLKIEADFLELCAVFANALIDQGIVTRTELCLRLQQARDAAVQSSGSVQGARAIIALLQRLGCTPMDEPSPH
jgi:hypothetical protein